MLVLGPTGAGKSRLLQHLLQTTRENFPMRGAGRTTVADTETIVDNVNFAAVVTFYVENEIREIVKENILEACAFAYREKGDKAKIASKLLVNLDKRFRFNFVLGNWIENTEAAGDDDFEFEEEDAEESDLETETNTAARGWTKLESALRKSYR